MPGVSLGRNLVANWSQFRVPAPALVLAGWSAVLRTVDCKTSSMPRQSQRQHTVRLTDCTDETLQHGSRLYCPEKTNTDRIL